MPSNTASLHKSASAYERGFHQWLIHGWHIHFYKTLHYKWSHQRPLVGDRKVIWRGYETSHDMHTFYPQKTTEFATEISRLRSSNTSIGLGNDSFVPESKKVCGLREQLGSFGIATTCVMRKTIALSGKQHRDRGSNWPQSSKVQPRAASVRTISTDVLWSCSVGINFLSWWWLSVFHINKALNI